MGPICGIAFSRGSLKCAVEACSPQIVGLRSAVNSGGEEHLDRILTRVRLLVKVDLVPSRASTPAPPAPSARPSARPASPEGAHVQPEAARPAARPSDRAKPSARPSAASARPSAAPPRRPVSRTRSLSPGIGIGALPGLPQLPEDDELALDVLGELYATAQQMAEASDAKRQKRDSAAKSARSPTPGKSAPKRARRRRDDTSEANVLA